jgi:NhaP-type Na+/H+ and K+/H+ antiporters
MEIVFTVLILLLAVAASGVVVRMLPIALPLPLVQIAIGALLAWPRLGLHVTFDPEIFMMLFIPPLLFADGWRIPKRELFMARRSDSDACARPGFHDGAGVGYFVHALVPSISLPVAFALAAVLSPTMRWPFPASSAKARFLGG